MKDGKKVFEVLLVKNRDSGRLTIPCDFSAFEESISTLLREDIAAAMRTQYV
jgi:hypothetical protein